MTLDADGEDVAAKEPHAVPEATMSPSEAVADIRELRRGVTLGGLRIKLRNHIANL
jgi:hypothetical protein